MGTSANDRNFPTILTSERTLIPFAIGLFVLVVHLLTNGQYGFHRDELVTLDDARYLGWGYVAYPPLTPFFGRISMEIFGSTSIAGARVFPALAMMFSILGGSWIARELGGKRFAQTTTALAVAVAPITIFSGSVLQYVSFDYLWWVMVVLFTAKLIRTGNPRWWIAIGVSVGLGMMTKYSMLFLVTSMIVGLLMTEHRRILATRWFWAGVAIACLILLPNAIWQIQHHFITLDFLKFIHARDVRIGRTSSFFSDQLKICTNLFTVPLWIAGLYFYFRSERGKPFRLLGWMFMLTLFLFAIGKGRGYYMGPGYPLLFAGGAVLYESWLHNHRYSQALRVATITVFAISGIVVALVLLPIPRPGTKWFAINTNLNGDLREEIGWPELTAEVAQIYKSIPPQQRATTGIFASNYGEAGAVNMYGAQYGLPKAISGTNSYWLRGYGSNPPSTVIVLGSRRKDLDRVFTHCELAGHNGNSLGVHNEESDDHPDIYLCTGMRMSWQEIWPHVLSFG
jgi:4-amino-4-deoxy-L-arabinose transferase-like glycosyltransferase